LLFGTPHGFNTHMQGLEILLSLRGGLDTLRYTSPSLCSLISWFDYSGSCNFFSKRRFSPNPSNCPLLPSDPAGVPENILESLPVGYDLYRDLADAFKGLELVTSVIQSENPTDIERSKSAAFIASVDSELHQTALMSGNHTALQRTTVVQGQDGPRSRRHNIRQSFHLLVLIYMACISGYDGASASRFLYRLEKALDVEASEWGSNVVELFRLLLMGKSVYSEEFAPCISRFIDIGVAMTWESWGSIKLCLLDFLLYNPACGGELQTLWRNRLKGVV